MKHKHVGPGLPENLVPPASCGVKPRRKAGPHDTRPRGQRDRSGARRAALSEQGA